MKEVKETGFKTFFWCMKLAKKMNLGALICWITLSIVTAVLPAVSLLCQRNILERLTMFVTAGTGQFGELMPVLMLLGAVIVLIGISGRLSSKFIFHTIYDYYFIGLSQRFMDLMQKIEWKTLRKKQVKDDYRYIKGKFGQLCSLLANFFNLLRQCITIISLLAIAASYSVIIFAISMIYLVFVLCINERFTGNRTYDSAQHRMYESRTKYYEQCAIDNGIAKEIRVFHNADSIVREWEREYDPIEIRDLKISRWKNIISFLCSMGYYILVLFILIYSIIQIRYSLLSVSIFLILYEMTRNMSESILKSSGTFHRFKRDLYDMSQLKLFMEETPQMPVRPNEMPEKKTDDVVFEAKNLCFSYDESEVLHNINFTIHKGETIALVGLNGSGKSTLVKLLTDLYHPTRGELCYCGVPYDRYPRGVINNDIGMFFQDFKIFHATLAENVGFGDLKNINDENKILTALKKGGALNLLKKMPGGLNTWLIRKVKKGSVNLSGGEQQKVAVSRAHMSDREVMIFDEPASALDPIAEMQQFKAIQDKIQGRTGILISHRVGFARMAERIFVLQNGYLEEVGTHEELMNKNGIYANFFLRQAEWYHTEIRAGGENELKV